MTLQHFPFFATIGRIGLLDFEMVTPAGQFQTVISELLRLLAQLLQWKIRPLSRK
jgi:hypothetical protein